MYDIFIVTATLLRCSFKPKDNISGIYSSGICSIDVRDFCRRNIDNQGVRSSLNIRPFSGLRPQSQSSRSKSSIIIPFFCVSQVHVPINGEASYCGMLSRCPSVSVHNRFVPFQRCHPFLGIANGVT